MYNPDLRRCCRQATAGLLPLLFAFLLGAAPEAALLAKSTTFPLVLAWSAREPGRADRAIWGDVENDGDLDLLVASEDMRLLLYLNSGTSLSFSAAWASDACGKATAAAWGDVNADGYLDLAVGACTMLEQSREVNRVRVFMNVQGVLQPTPAWQSNEEGNFASVAFADIDGDQFPELAAGNNGGRNYVYHNSGGVLENPAAMASQDTDATYDVAWADIDNNGLLDLTTANLGQSVRVYQNVAGKISPIGDPITPATYNGTPEPAHRLAWADIDGDHDVDLALANEGIARIYTNNAGALTFAASVGTAAYPGRGSSVGWGDVDGDGDVDLALGNFQSPSRIFLNQGGVISTVDSWWTDFDATTDVAWGDLDADGDLDLAVANWGVSRVYLNQNTVLQDQLQLTSYEPAGRYARGVAWGDVDRDGYLDLAVASYGETDSGQQSRLYHNNGGRLSHTPSWQAQHYTKGMAVAWGDVNGDRCPDLAIASATRPNLVYYLNTGGALGAQPAWEADTSVAVNGLAWGDVDSDGDLDLATAAKFAIDIYINQGGALQKTPDWSYPTPESNRSVAWGDVDQDGDLDLAAGNDKVVSVVFRNDNGQLTKPPIWASPLGDGTKAVVWADIDGLNGLDLVTGNWGQPDCVYTNTNGILSPEPVWSSVETQTSWDIAAADADGNGYLDLLAGSDWENYDRLTAMTTAS